MTWPPTLDLRVELDLAGTWTDVSSYVRHSSGVDIARGRPDEASTVDTGSLRLTLDNRDGRFSPRNPSGAYYGSLGRNTPIRCTAHGLESPYLTSADGTGTFTTPDSASNSITGDIDIRLDLEPITWTPVTSLTLASKYGSSGNYSWLVSLGTDGVVSYTWSATGTSTTTVSSTVPMLHPWKGRRSLRVTHDVNNGAAGNDVAFYTSDSVTGTWTQLGSTVTTSGTTSIYDSTVAVDAIASSTIMRLHHFQLRNGIGGTVVLDPDVNTRTVGDTSWADSAGATWTVAGGATVTDTTSLFSGEVSAWPIQWDISGNDATAQVTASGILRRLSQGSAPLESTMRRGISVLPNLVAYWPCEDGAGSTTIASAAATGQPMRIIGSPQLASSTTIEASSALPSMANANFVGQVPGYTSTGSIQVRYLMLMDSAGSVTGDLLNIDTTGTAVSWALRYVTGFSGSLQLVAVDSSRASILDTGAIGFAVDGRQLWVSVELVQNGADIDWAMKTLQVGATSGNVWSGTLVGYTVGAATLTQLNHGRLHNSLVMGHLAVESAATDLFTLSGQLNAWRLEYAAKRVERLCIEEGVPVQRIGAQASTQRMGAQRADTLLSLLREAEAVDGGVLYEPREYLGLAYRINESIAHQTSPVTLDYVTDGVQTLTPVDDDQLLRNDVTASRPGGSEATITLTSGALSTAAPPDGVGTYATSITTNTATDLQLVDQAGWRVHLGTADAPRYPDISVELARPAYTADLPLSVQLLTLDVGDRLTITSPPGQLPPDAIDQIVQGVSVSADRLHALVGWSCSPAAPWRTGILDTTARLSSDGSTLAANVTTTATSWSVATASGPLWSTAAGDYPLDMVCGGERVTVTAVSGAASPQTFTVTRSVNGVVAAHTSGDAVELFEPIYFGL